MVIPGEEGRLALRGVALLTRVGFVGEVEGEGRAIADFMGIPWNRMQAVLAPAMEQGVLVRRGRYWYVSPELLAVWLAAEVWRHQGHRILDFHDGLPTPASQEAFRTRLAALGHLDSVRRVLASLLGERGPFRDLASLSEPQSARLFATIAEGAPKAAIGTLKRLIDSASTAELLAFDGGRRDVVWVLEKLAGSRETFFHAARLLGRLAEAENEHIADNAIDIWRQLFRVVLAPTEVPFRDRLPLLEEALASERPSMRRLAVAGIESALEGRETAIMPGRGHRVPPAYWRPGTPLDVRNAKVEVLPLLERALVDPEADVRSEARRVLVRQARFLVDYGLADQVIDLIGRFEVDDEAERRRIWEAIMEVLRFESRYLSDDQRRRLEEEASSYLGDTLHDRFRRFLGRIAMVDWEIGDDEGRLDPDSVAAALAEEVSAAPEVLSGNLPWLVSGEALNVWPFAVRLGELDLEEQWLQPALEAAVNGDDSRLVSGYLVGRERSRRRTDPGWLDRLLDRWSGEQRLARIVFDATLRRDGSNRAVARLIQLVDRRWLDPQLLGLLHRGRWARDVSAESLVALVDRQMSCKSADATGAALALVGDWFEDRQRGPDALVTDAAWRLLEDRHGWDVAPMVAHYWERVGRHLLEDDPVRIARIMASASAEESFVPDDERLHLLAKAVALEPKRTWFELGRALLAGGGAYRLAWELQDISVVERVPSEIVIDWIEQNGPEAASAVAQALKPAGEQLPEVIRYLLRQHSERVADTLAANFASGGWVGSHAAFLESKRAVARAWLEDPVPAVREWAGNVDRWLEREIESVRVFEEEQLLA